MTENGKIAYKAGYKYQLAQDYTVEIGLLGYEIDTEYISLTITGRLTIRKGYAWDGPSGPTIDTLSFMRGSLVHDALYQLFREGVLNRWEWRKFADKLLYKHCREDGMYAWRAWWVYWALRIAGGSSAKPSHKKPVIKAP